MEEVTTTSGDKTVLFLTNMQAALFNSDNVHQVLAAFELPQPQLVIQLMPTKQGSVEDNHMLQSGMDLPRYCSGSLDPHETMAMDRDLTIFFRDVLLPLAAAANAFIIASLDPTCALTHALGEALRFIRPRYGRRLPFTIIGIDTVLQFHGRATASDGNFTASLANGSKRWRSQMPKLQQFWSETEQLSQREGRAQFFFSLSRYLGACRRRTPRTRVGLNVPNDASHPRSFRRGPPDGDLAPQRSSSTCAERLFKNNSSLGPLAVLADRHDRPVRHTAGKLWPV